MPLMKSWTGRGISTFVADKTRFALLLSDDGEGDLNTADADADADADDDELVEAAVAGAAAAAAVLCCRNEIAQTSTRKGIYLGTRDLRDACNMYDQ